MSTWDWIVDLLSSPTPIWVFLPVMVLALLLQTRHERAMREIDELRTRIGWLEEELRKRK